MARLPDLFGLWVDLGDFNHRRGQWVREPHAEFTCAAGCEHHASGPAAVAQFCRAIRPWHNRNCPGRGTNADHS